MLFYLDNTRSVAAPENRRFPMMMNRGAINENYAREIMELHTLGVDGGYTQKDVTELARVLTGWSIGRPQDRDGGGAFIYRPFAHDHAEKAVLGVHFGAGGGSEEGQRTGCAATVRTPSEYGLSAPRASNAKVVNPIPVARALQQIGEPLYGAQPPTGYSDKAEAWMNSGAEVNRMNFAVDLASNKLPGVMVQTGDANKLALELGSPEFQRQ